MRDKYYVVVLNNNEKPYAFFEYGINWIPKDFIHDKITEGYIVQKVIIENSIDIKEINDDLIDKKLEYYEAWKIENSKYINHKDKEPDDLIGFGNKNAIGDVISVSLEKIGDISYNTEVYWINKKNKYFSNIESWKYEVKQANGLKSRLLKNCSELINEKPIFSREKIIHKVNFIDESVIEKAVRESFKVRIEEKDSSLCEYLKTEVLVDKKYYGIIDRISRIINS